MEKLIAGVDSSTQATKVVVVDADSGRLRAEGRAPHEVTGAGGTRESDPRTWWQALATALRQTGLADKVSAISVAAQQHGLIALDVDGEPVRDAVLWNDTRAADDSAALINALGAEHWAEWIGSVPAPAFTVSSWAWLRRTEPELAARVRAVRLPHDYLTERLTGNAVTDRGDASGTGWWSVTAETYAADVLSLPTVGLAEDALPRVLAPGEPAGTVTAAAARATGLREGVPVGPGTGDNMAAALGLGLGRGQIALSLGTSGTVFARANHPTGDPGGIIAGFADATGEYLPLACTLNCTLAVDHVAALLGVDREAVADDTELIALPYLDGERTPDLPLAGGTILGLRHGSTPGEILLATYRGAVASLMRAADRIAEQVPAVDHASPVVLIGGGARGAVWRRTVAELSGRPMIVPEPAEFVARGAAAQAASALGVGAPGDVGARWAGAAPAERVPASTRRDDVLAGIDAAIEAVGPFYGDG